MSRLDHANDLVRHCKDLLPHIAAEYESSLNKKQVEAKLLIDIKNFMENLRSALDYSANEIFIKYGHSPKAKPRIYFP